MSREITFRAWDEDCEVMYYSDAGWNETHPESEDCFFDFHKGHVVAFLRQTEPGTIDEPPYDYGEPVDVEQYTGLPDKNGVEIYEGDVLAFWSEWDGKQMLTAPVTWRQEVCLMAADIGMALTTPVPEDLYEEIAESSYEVIGNIHENPELVNA